MDAAAACAAALVINQGRDLFQLSHVYGICIFFTGSYVGNLAGLFFYGFPLRIVPIGIRPNRNRSQGRIPGGGAVRIGIASFGCIVAAIGILIPCYPGLTAQGYRIMEVQCYGGIGPHGDAALAPIVNRSFIADGNGTAATVAGARAGSLSLSADGHIIGRRSKGIRTHSYIATYFRRCHVLIIANRGPMAESDGILSQCFGIRPDGNGIGSIVIVIAIHGFIDILADGNTAVMMGLTALTNDHRILFCLILIAYSDGIVSFVAAGIFPADFIVITQSYRIITGHSIGIA